MLIIKISNIIPIVNLKLIQIGLNIYHYDQAITLVNFNTIKAIVNNPENPIPL